MTSSPAAARPLLAVPLHGAECVHCGRAARGLAILPDRRIVAHVAAIPHCSTPITGAPEPHSTVLRATLRPGPAEPTVRGVAA
jgi:hypothetical protein